MNMWYMSYSDLSNFEYLKFFFENLTPDARETKQRGIEVSPWYANDLEMEGPHTDESEK